MTRSAQLSWLLLARAGQAVADEAIAVAAGLEDADVDDDGVLLVEPDILRHRTRCMGALSVLMREAPLV